MKIKFLKEFRVINVDIKDINLDTTIEAGEVNDFANDESAQWLIDNGFAEKDEDDKGWLWPEIDDTYYYVRDTKSMFMRDEVARCSWADDGDDQYRYSIGNVFKTLESARRFIDYLKAVETVRHDEGFMRKNGGGFGWPVIEFTANNPGVEDIAGRQHAGEFYFDTREHALDSAINHTREWQTILNYDWSKGAK